MLSSFFPSRTIALYMGRLFLTRTFGILFGLVLILQTLDLLSESGRVLAAPGNGDAEIWRYVSLRVPQIVSTFLPFSVLLGTILTLITMNANSEVVALKAGGLSAHQVLAPLLVASLGVAVLTFAFNDRIVSRATAELSTWQDVNYGPMPVDRGDRSNVWVRSGDDLIQADRIAGRGNDARLGGVTVYERNAGGGLRGMIAAPHGVRDGDGWRIWPARRFDVASGAVTQLGQTIVGRGVTPDQFTLSNVDGDALSFTGLRAAIEALGYVPHAGARSLSLARTQAIGVVLPDLHGEFFSEIVRGMDRAVTPAGYHLLLSNMHADADLAAQALARAPALTPSRAAPSRSCPGRAPPGTHWRG